MLALLAACGSPRPVPAVTSTARWQEVEALAAVDCDPWPEDRFPTDLAPRARREAIRAWHAEAPGAVIDVDARYVTFSYVDATAPEDVPAIAHLVGSLRACGRWADARHEEVLALRACAADPAATAEAFLALPPAPPEPVRAAREAVWLVDTEAPEVTGRFTASLLLGTKEWLARWVLDGGGAPPAFPENLPIAQLLREELRPADPGVPEACARCAAGAASVPFRVPAPASAGVVRATVGGGRVLWWPDDGVLGDAGPFGPLTTWAEATPTDLLVGALRRAEHCPGRFHWEAELPAGDPAAADGAVVAVALPPGVPLAHRVAPDACGPALVGPGGTWSLGCCAP